MARNKRQGGRTRSSRKGVSAHVDKYANKPKFDNVALNARFKKQAQQEAEEAHRVEQDWHNALKPIRQETWEEEHMEQERRLLP